MRHMNRAKDGKHEIHLRRTRRIHFTMISGQSRVFIAPAHNLILEQVAILLCPLQTI